MYRFLPIPREDPVPPEFVYVPIECGRHALALWGRIARWNGAWEARHLRHNMFRSRDLPQGLRWIKRHPDCDFRLVPLEDNNRFPAFAMLYHLLPLPVLRRFGLPPLKRAGWPFSTYWDVDTVLPADWGNRLAKAVAFHLWPRLCPNSSPSMFSATDPVHLLAHNLDFWVPYLDLVVQRRRLQAPRCRFDADDPGQRQVLRRTRRKLAAHCDVERPLMGGTVWMGEDDVADVACQLIDTADEHGRLRGILDAVRSSRVVDDFSSRWSWAKEDFERRLYRKRSKVRVVFVELSDTVPVHGPEAEIHETLLWEDFLALLDVREPRVVVCLRSGITKATEIADELGYANHSPVSKALARIRQKAARFLGIDVGDRGNGSPNDLGRAGMLGPAARGPSRNSDEDRSIAAPA